MGETRIAGQERGKGGPGRKDLNQKPVESEGSGCMVEQARLARRQGTGEGTLGGQSGINGPASGSQGPPVVMDAERRSMHQMRVKAAAEHKGQVHRDLRYQRDK